MKYIIGINVLHIASDNGSLCRNRESRGERGYELDVLTRIDRVKPLCERCKEKKIDQLMCLKPKPLNEILEEE